MAIKLHPVESSELERLVFEKSEQEIVIWRHEACDFVLDSSYVSRRHASLLFE
jgi:pSer/pThr/pTyr-binding forkhead associated (FHA) protein